MGNGSDVTNMLNPLMSLLGGTGFADMFSQPTMRERIWPAVIGAGASGLSSWADRSAAQKQWDEENEAQARAEGILDKDRLRAQILENERYQQENEYYNRIIRPTLGGREQAIGKFWDSSGIEADPESFPEMAVNPEFRDGKSLSGTPGYDASGKGLPGAQAANQRYQALLAEGPGVSPLAGTEQDLSSRKKGGGILSKLLKYGLPAAGIALALGGFGVPGFKFFGPAAGGIGKFMFGSGGGAAGSSGTGYSAIDALWGSHGPAAAAGGGGGNILGGLLRNLGTAKINNLTNSYNSRGQYSGTPRYRTDPWRDGSQRSFGTPPSNY